MSKNKVEFGDFQTSKDFSLEICKFLLSKGINPNSIVEPTCGRGSFIFSSLETFISCKNILGYDINKIYLDYIRNNINSHNLVKLKLKEANFFCFDWKKLFNNLEEPILIIGNPPWVTNAALGILNSNNLPVKSNFQNHKGFDAKTGKANFDISEWMITHLLEWMQNRNSILAMLCKTAVARKVLKHAWRYDFPISKAFIHLIDAKKYFCVSVDACLFICICGKSSKRKVCNVYEGLSDKNVLSRIGIHKNELLADIVRYKNLSYLDGKEYYKWRSGVKHDCAKVMELTYVDNKYINGYGEAVELENDYIYPLLKSSDIANNKVIPRKWVLITQKKVGEDTSIIRDKAPNTWLYLNKYAHLLENRRSMIYKKNPQFSIFGIGDYSFAPWKVAISGLYKHIKFSVLGTYKKKPIILDDTCYSIPCKNKNEAILLSELLNSEIAKEFISTFIFWDSKRPITIDVLKRIDILALANKLEKEDQLKQYIPNELPLLTV